MRDRKRKYLLFEHLSQTSSLITNFYNGRGIFTKREGKYFFSAVEQMSVALINKHNYVISEKCDILK